MANIKTLDQYELELRTALKNTMSRESMVPAGRVLVGIRRNHFIQAETGNPDYQGRSYAYRNWHSEFMKDLYPDEVERKSVSARLRYAVGVALREMLTPDEIELAELRPISPKERIANNNRERAGAYKLLTEKIKSEDDVLELVSLISRVASNIDDKDLQHKLIKHMSNLDKLIK
ncbi:hypothetical protein [Glutamicibacter sp. TV12E]|uniref:hypothetical protein n=1 Tax=Glutamicibacter sp. TV12E TaxID=3446362 RepID=UPI00403341CC